MAEWSQSHFLQSLGWATLNSFWQIALLWCIYSIAHFIFKFSSNTKFQFSVSAIIGGFGWFVFTFIAYYNEPQTFFSFSETTLSQSNKILNICLISASSAYLCMLFFPSYKLFKNWQFVQIIKKEGLTKANLHFRLFTQKISDQLSISKKVVVYVSEIISSPVTIGYIKPVILLPVAAVNSLSVLQVEAILLHELSHIKRFDYFINFLLCIIHTLLYFNPFVKLFLRQIESEREACCDEMVLQFGYDKISYASALLTLQRNSSQQHLLALGATGKNNLLTRIEKIVGMEKKKSIRLSQFLPILAALICILTFNSVLIIKDTSVSSQSSYMASTVVDPFFIQHGEIKARTPVPAETLLPAEDISVVNKKPVENTTDILIIDYAPAPNQFKTTDVQNKDIHPVNFDVVDGSLTKEEKEQVKTTVEATKKVMSTLQWQEVETSVADAFNKEEKAIIKQEYLNELEELNWKNIENNLKANYDNIDWNKVNSNINSAMSTIQLDSIQRHYSQILLQLEKAESDMKAKVKTSATPMPDRSLEEIKIAIEELKKNIQSVKNIREKKVIRI